MKINRLLNMVIYLLNREVVSAAKLSEKFDVSVRTIQRDIDSLSMAGIPIYSQQGPDGGYSIMENFKLNDQILNIDNFIYIIKALKSLSTAYENEKINNSLEKVLASFPDDKNNNLKKRNSQFTLDLSILRESSRIDNYLTITQKAIKNKKIIQFDYTNANHGKTTRKVEPLSVTFKWYAWYLFAFCRLRNDYRLFRISRIRKLKLTDDFFKERSEDIKDLLDEYFKNDQREYIDLKLLCEPEVQVSLEDYFPNANISKKNKKVIMEISLPVDEKHWIGVIISFGNKIKILEPDFLQEKKKKKATELMKLYQ